MMKTRKGHNVYPITVAQKFHLYYAKYCPNMAVLNIGTSLTIGTELDWNVLRDSINYAYARNEAMRIRFTRDKDGECYQYIADVDEDFKERTVDFRDFTDLTMEEAENEMQGWTQVPFEFEDSPMTKIVMIKMPDGFNGVYFLGHHMVVDAQSLIAFLKDIIEIYCNAMYEGVPFPKDMCSYIEQLKKDLAYEAGSKAQLRDREFFEKYIADVDEDFKERTVDFRDFTDLTMEEAENEMQGWTQVPFEFEDSPMTKIVMIKMPDGFNGVYFLGHHMVVDAQSLIAFLKDIIEIYCNAMYEGVPFPKDMCSYIEQLKKDLAYEAGSKAQLRDREFFEKLIRQSEPIYNGIDGTAKLDAARELMHDNKLRSAFNASDDVTSALDIFHLEAEPTKRLMDFCEKYHISLACLLLMGIRTFFQKENGFDDVSVNNAIARRATLKEKKSGGTRIHSFPFRTCFSKDVRFIDAVYTIRDKQNELFRHANYNPTEYFALRSKTYPQPKAGLTYEPMSLTYQPMTLKEKGLNDLGDIKYKTKWYPNGMTTQAMYLTVMHRPEDNGLDFSFEHQVKAVSRKQLEYMYYYLCKIMFKGAENPELTIGEIIKLV